MEPDRDKLEYYSLDAIDKVVHEGIEAIPTAGPSGPLYATSDEISVREIANPYGKKCMVRFRWKIDSEDWQSQDSKEVYSFSIDATALGGPILDGEPGTKGAVAVGVSDSIIKFRINNGHHGDVVYTLGDDQYTPIPHTYTIEYALYEVD